MEVLIFTEFELEDDWRKIVDNWSSLTERLQQQQNAVWELVTTEATYIKTLRVISDVSYTICISVSNFSFKMESTKKWQRRNKKN